MMVMSRDLKTLVIFALGAWLFSCGEEAADVESQGEIEKIREDYMADMKSKEMRVRQRAVALYFIDKLALR